jgi:class 3 adenylate cyclase/pimeloyl-ACP methyl ester carboxylesterase
VEPRIRYAQASDGVSIAHFSVGSGPPFLVMPHPPWSNIQREWQDPHLRTWFEAIAARRTLVTYDSRGSGLSDRDVDDFSLEAHVRDLEAVVDQLGLDRFVLFGPAHSGPAAVAYASRHPQRLSQLILWCTYARGADYRGSSPQLQATRAILDQDWEVYTETVAHVTWGWSAGDEARRFAAFIREAVDRPVVEKVRDAVDAYDVSDLLPGLNVPTLVIHRRNFLFPRAEVARKVAARIPDCRLVILEGASPAPFMGNVAEALDAIGEFTGESFPPPVADSPAGAGPPLVTILFTDMEGSTALGQRLGDAAAHEIRRSHNEIVREALRARGGSEIKHTGDGIMASFLSASRALECAAAIQRAFEARYGAELSPVRVRVGLNAGEPIADERDLFGSAVNMASRIAAEAGGGEILVSDVVRQLVLGRRFLFAERGAVALRGFDEPVRLFELRWQEEV